MKYLDFDLLIEPSGEGFTARVLNSPGGQASADFTAPFSDLEIENFLLKMGRSRHAVRRIESPETATAKLFGGRLFSSVFAGDVRDCFRGSMDEANRQGLGLRLRLHLGKAPALADLPWEFLYNVGMNRFLGLSVETPVVRYLELAERIRPFNVKPPLRVLVMISSPTDYPQLDVKRESDKLNEALAELEERGRIIVERQEVATLTELQHRLRRSEYHIFHFIGHGGFDDQAQDGLLILEDEKERGLRVPAQDLGTLLHDHRPLRLAVLNACEGARASRADPFAGTAQSLVQQGIPAVIAMQFEVTDEAAICFTREFYSAIATGYPVDAALAEARKAISTGLRSIEWGTPVLYMRSPDGLIFEMEQVSEADLKKLKTTAQARASRVEEFRKGAVAAMKSEQWDDALEKWQALLASSPDDQDARSQVGEARKQQELARLYVRGVSHYELRNWKEAQVEFHQLHRIAKPYKDVEDLVATIERELQREAKRELLRRELQREAKREARNAVRMAAPDAVPPQQIRPATHPVAVASTAERKAGRARSFFMGSILGAVAVVCVLVVGIVMIVSVYDSLNDNVIPVNTSAMGGGLVNPPAPSPRPTNLATPVERGRVATVAPPVAPADPVDPNEMVPASPALFAELQIVVYAADQAEIQAFQTLNPAFLQGRFTGGILNNQLTDLDSLKAQGRVIVSTLHNVTFHGASVSRNKQRAQVRVTERWSSNILTLLGQCVARYRERDLPQTQYLQRSGAGWLVYDVKHDGDQQPERAACN